MKFNKLLLTIAAAGSAFACTPKDNSPCTPAKDIVADNIAFTAKSFVGVLKHKYGGDSLTTGCDNSGFVQKIYEKFDIKLPRNTWEQFNKGKEVSVAGSCGVDNAKVGDLIFTCHSNGSPKNVMIYAGNNSCVHAHGSAKKVAEFKLDGKTKICKIRRVFECQKPQEQTLNDKIVAEAKKYVNKLRYVYGGISLKIGTDNSGFVQQLYKKFYINLPRTAKEQAKKGIKVKLSGKYGVNKAQAGDLLFTCHHNGSVKDVYVFIGGKSYINCSKSGKKVVEAKLNRNSNICKIRRVIDLVQKPTFVKPTFVKPTFVKPTFVKPTVFVPQKPTVVVPQKPVLPVCSGKKITEEAKKYVNKLKFVHKGADLHTGVDCSGFVQQIFKKFEVTLPNTIKEQFTQGIEVDVNEAKVGDLIFTCHHDKTPKNVMIFTGNNNCIHAHEYSKKVVETKFEVKDVCGCRRVISEQ